MNNRTRLPPCQPSVRNNNKPQTSLALFLLLVSLVHLHPPSLVLPHLPSPNYPRTQALAGHVRFLLAPRPFWEFNNAREGRLAWPPRPPSSWLCEEGLGQVYVFGDTSSEHVVAITAAANTNAAITIPITISATPTAHPDRATSSQRQTRFQRRFTSYN